MVAVILIIYIIGISAGGISTASVMARGSNNLMPKIISWDKI
jgi:hypothetical protein